MIYLDSAAVVKLVHAEVHSAALREFLDRHTEVEWVSSALVEVETYRALSRATAAVGTPTVVNEFHALLDLIVRIEIDPGVRIRTQTVSPPAARSLDAIHLATGLRLRDRGQLTSFVTYDKRLADAASAAGLTLDAPTD